MPRFFHAFKRPELEFRRDAVPLGIGDLRRPPPPRSYSLLNCCIGPKSNIAGALHALPSCIAAEFYTKNSDTDYQNGEIFRLDFTAIKRFSNNLGIGIVGGWIQQVSDDEGGIAAELDGFRGRALGIGPIVTWAWKLGGKDVSFDLRWVNEFDVENRPDGDALLFNASLPF